MAKLSPKKKTYSKEAKNFTLTGMILVLLLVVIVGYTNRMRADLSFRQPRQDLILYINHNMSAAQSLPGEHCWNHRFSIPVVVQAPYPNSDVGYYVDASIRTTANPQKEIAQLSHALISRALTEIEITTPKAPEEGQDCYILFETNSPEDSLGLWLSEGNSLDDASIYFNHQPASYDLVFNSYKPIQLNGLLSGFGNAALPSLELLGISLLYMITGMCIQLLIEKEGQQFHLILAFFLGIGSMMTLVLVLSILRIRIENWTLFGWSGLIVLAAILKILIKPTSLHWLKTQLSTLCWQDGLLFLGFVLLLLMRISQTSGLFVPSWMDSIFHANIVEGFLEQGHIPANLNYHFGYHLLAFLNCKLFGWNNPTSMLLTGQWLNVLLSLSLLYYINQIYQNRKLSIFSVILFSLFSVFPAYLVNWSRFSIVLGSAFALVIAGKLLATGQKWSIATIITTGILLLAQVMTHYTSVVLTGFICLIPALSLLRQFNFKKILKTIKNNIPAHIAIITGVSVLAIGAFILSRIFSMAQAGEFADILSSSKELTQQFSLQYFWYLASDISGWFVLLIGAFGIFWMLFAGKSIKEKKILQITWGWFIFLGLFVTLQNAIFGGSQPSLINVFIWFFIPLSISAGFFWERLFHWFARIFPQPGRYTLTGAITLLIIVGIFISPIIINPLTIMYSDADHQALSWMKKNLTEDDWILINAAPFEDRLQPIDGGGWIPYLSDLNITHPNLEQSQDFSGWFSSINIDYIYQGSQGNAYDLSFFEKENIELIPVYQNNGVLILRVDQNR